MSTIRIRTTIPIAGSVVLDLAPFDRFGGRGGRASLAITGVAAEADGDLTMDALIGSDTLIRGGQITGESSLNRGPDSETPRVGGIGGPGDPITVQVFNANAATRDVITELVVENA